MDLLDKVEEITMTNLLVLYNTNIMFPLVEPKQQWLDAKEELQEKDTYVLARKKKKGRKVVHGVVTKEVSMRKSSRNFSIPRSSQSCMVGR
jgi:hypothetical protein